MVDGRQQGLPNRTVVLVPDLRHRHRRDLYKVAATDSAGRFRLDGLTPGDYKVFAWEIVEPGAWENSEFLSKYEELGQAITVAPNAK